MYQNLALSENGFLFDTRTGFTYSLNKTGAVILRGLIEGAKREEIVERLTARFDVEAEIAERDVEQFEFRIRDIGVVEGEGENNG